MASGTITRSRIWSSLAPSTLAASDSSWGMVRKNWRSRKMVNASPKNNGMISGLSDPIQPSRTKMTYSGTMVTCGGSISVDSTSMNAAWRPRHWSRDSA